MLLNQSELNFLPKSQGDYESDPTDAQDPDIFLSLSLSNCRLDKGREYVCEKMWSPPFLLNQSELNFGSAWPKTPPPLISWILKILTSFSYLGVFLTVDKGRERNPLISSEWEQQGSNLNIKVNVVKHFTRCWNDCLLYCCVHIPFHWWRFSAKKQD